MPRKPFPCAICGQPLTPSRTTAPEGVAAHGKCKVAAREHGTVAKYREGCRCAPCKAGNNVAIRAYNQAHKERTGATYDATRRRKVRGAPLRNDLCTECGDPLAYNRGAKVPRHARCKNGYIPDYRAKRDALLQRDQATCQICLEPVEQHTPQSDWWPTLDHITPRSQGGTDALDNLRLAHRWCNSARGAARYTDEDFRQPPLALTETS